MGIFMVERNLKGISMEALAAAQHAAIAQGRKMTAEGTPIRYIRSTFTPADGSCMCLFDASDVADVTRLNNEARLPYYRVVEALDLTP